MKDFGIARFPGFWAGFVALCICLTPIAAESQERAVTMQVAEAKEGASCASDASHVVVWLSPLNHSAQNSADEPAVAQSPQLVQRNKSFEPHVLVVRVGTVVQCPNKDPFFQNIFSLYDGKSFDLGLYEAGTTRSVRFDRPGVSFLFCNIHAEMSAVVIAVDTPYFAMSDRNGHLMIPDVPDGRYQMHVWYERSLPENLKGLSRVVTISNQMRALGEIHVIDNPNYTFAHKNKYGEDYVPPPTEGYQHP